MPTVIDYAKVQERMRHAGFVSLYHNSGAFGFADTAGVCTFGLIGPADPSIREGAKAHAQNVPLPYESNLADRLATICDRLQTTVWLMPKSHWHYELHFGNRELLEATLAKIGINADLLRDRNEGSAIEFLSSEYDLLKQTVKQLLEGLAGSDFLLVLNEVETLCTIHHHKQLWWQTRNENVIAELSQT